MYVITFNPDQPYDILFSGDRSAWETEKEALHAVEVFKATQGTAATHGEPIYVHKTDWPGSSMDGVHVCHPVPRCFTPCTVKVGYAGSWTVRFRAAGRHFEMLVQNGDERQALIKDMISDAMGTLFILDAYIPDESDAQWWLVEDGITYYAILPERNHQRA
jgi:hypothetical protein